MKEKFYILIKIWVFDKDSYVSNSNDVNMPSGRKVKLLSLDRSWDHYFYEKEIEISTYRSFKVSDGLFGNYIEIDDDYLFLDTGNDKKYSWKSIELFEETRNELYKLDKSDKSEIYDPFNNFRKSIRRDIKLKELFNE